ncbi:hypothetical protein GCM10010210_11140 [Pseudonocardia hydrocarbonoxydans]|uniref:Uncharacterized protein n=1 Tax=Pseudonocardia hydrocarbonoxydans TaxID=76726 RepID=A0A4Y3WSN9_9PSEU|nr:hypothetical protein PHY01_41480 [Pseudonocardia hydrocarbonoxydans]
MTESLTETLARIKRESDGRCLSQRVAEDGYRVLADPFGDKTTAAVERRTDTETREQND